MKGLLAQYNEAACFGSIFFHFLLLLVELFFYFYSCWVPDSGLQLGFCALQLRSIARERAVTEYDMHS